MTSAASLGTLEHKLLRELLAARSPPTRAKLARGAAAPVLDRLVQMGLVRTLPAGKGRAARFELSHEGRRCAEEITRRYPARISLSMLYAEVLRIGDELEDLRTRLAPPAPKKSAGTNGNFERELRAALGELDRRGRYGGLVPIPELRRALAPLHLSREDFDRALLEQERAFAVDLKTAHDPTSIKDSDQAVWDEGRGWLYYAVAR
jgi:hypothetical protein